MAILHSARGTRLPVETDDATSAGSVDISKSGPLMQAVKNQDPKSGGASLSASLDTLAISYGSGPCGRNLSAFTGKRILKRSPLCSGWVASIKCSWRSSWAAFQVPRGHCRCWEHHPEGSQRLGDIDQFADSKSKRNSS